nr:hypothetical protein [Paenarthrobacter sp. MMS21-TAE1-1]
MKAPALPERLLLGAQGTVFGSQTLHRFNTGAIDFEGKRGAGSHGNVINEHRAGAANTALT